MQSVGLPITVDLLIAVANKGGVENVIKQMIPFLAKRNIRFRVIQMVWEHESWLDESVEFHYIYDDRNGQTMESFVKGYQCFLETHGQPDLILATAWPLMTLIARYAVEQCNKKPKIISWLHAPIERYVQAGYGGLECLKYADVHFAITDEIARSIMNANPESIVYRVKNPVKIPNKICDVYKTKHALAYVGRLSKEKNIEMILKAIGVAKGEWHLDIIGTGSEEQALKALCEQLQIQYRVKFYGWQDQPFAVAQKAEALVLTSHYEGFPLVLIEALSYGLPVISTPTNGAIELICPGENGFLVPMNDVEGLVEILDALEVGMIAFPDAVRCKQSVKEFRVQYVLEDFYIKLRSVYCQRILSTRYGPGKQHLYYTEKVSIIIPCYNVENKVGRCLDSVFGQSIGLEYLEVIAVNTASTDRTLEILTCYEQMYSEQMLVVNCENSEEQLDARDIGKSYASGQYILFVEVDDCIAEDMAEKFYLASCIGCIRN